MVAPYAWHCFACGEVNPPELVACAACGFPARATGAEIAAAQATMKPGAKLLQTAVQDESTLESIANALSPLSFWRQCIVVFGALASFGGFIWLKATFSFVEAAWSIAAVVVGLALVGFGYAGLSPSTSSAKSRSIKRDG